MKDEASLKNVPFRKVLLGYLYFVLLAALFLYFGLFSSLPALLEFRQEILQHTPLVSIHASDLYMVVWSVPSICFPIAFFPQQWSSRESSSRRLRWFVPVVAVAILLNLYIRIRLEAHLETYLAPEGYVQCETERQGHKLMMKTYEFAQDTSLCKDGAKTRSLNK